MGVAAHVDHKPERERTTLERAPQAAPARSALVQAVGLYVRSAMAMPGPTGWTPDDPVPDGTFGGVAPNPALCGGTVLNLPQIGRAGRLTRGQRERSGVR